MFTANSNVGESMEDKTLASNRSTQYPNHTNLAQDFADFILARVKKIDSSNELISSTKNSNDYKQIIRKALFTEDYAQAIWGLAELIDFYQGIRWDISPVNKLTGHEVLIRDARKSTKPNPCGEPYVIMAISYIIAAKMLLPPELPSVNRNYLKHLLRNFYLIVQHEKDVEKVFKEFKKFNTYLRKVVACYLNISLKDAWKRLTIAKDFANFISSSKDIVTLSRLKTSTADKFITVFQGDIALTQLTPELSQEYQERKTKVWYTILPPWQRGLVDKCTPYIVRGDRVLPTQIRWTPGLRNSYHTVNGILVLPHNNAIVTTQVFRSGTIIYLGENNVENQRIALLNGKQLQFFTNAKTLLALTLNSKDKSHRQ